MKWSDCVEICRVRAPVGTFLLYYPCLLAIIAFVQHGYIKLTLFFC